MSKKRIFISSLTSRRIYLFLTDESFFPFKLWDFVQVQMYIKEYLCCYNKRLFN